MTTASRRSERGPVLAGSRVIRALRLYDVPVVDRMRGDPLAGTPATLDPGAQLSLTTLLATSAASRGSRRVFVDVRRMRVRGFVHLVRRPGGQRWEITHLGHSGRGDAAGDCSDLLQFACAWAATVGATKITARVHEDDDRLMLFSEVGFRKYAQETVLVLEGEPAGMADASEPSTRGFVESDQWALHRIYTRVAPHGVQFVENLTSREHTFPTRGSPLGIYTGYRVRCEVLQDGPEVVAVVSFVVRRPLQLAIVHVSMLPSAAPHVQRLLHARLVTLRQEGIERIATTVRNYEVDTLTVVRHLGFEPVQTRAVLVKHTAAHIHEARSMLALERGQGLLVVKSTRAAMRPTGCHQIRRGAAAEAREPASSGH